MPLILFICAVWLPAVSSAQDKAKNDLSHEGELRVRETWDINPRLANHAKPNSASVLAERFKVELGFKPSEKVGTTLTLINNFNFGDTLGDPVNVPNGHAGPQDYVTVNQAYGNWLVTDEFWIRFGRMNYQIGGGTLIAKNDYQNLPYGFDGVLFGYEADFARFEGFAFKFRELGSAGDATPSAGQPSASDAERNAYGLNFDLKTRPEWIREVNAHVVQDTSDGLVDDPNDPGRGLTRFGATAGVAYRFLDFKLWYEGMTGRYYKLHSDGEAGEVTAEGSMIQAEVGATWSNFLGLRFFLKYHVDSGTKDSIDPNGKQGAYDPYFNEQHCSAGCMDLLGWGNLTSVELGWSLKPFENTEMGLDYWTFAKSERATSADTPAATPASGPTMGPGGLMGAGGNPDHSMLGQEVDIWAEHHFGDAISILARVGEFFPGDVYKAGGAAQSNPLTQFFAQARMTF